MDFGRGRYEETKGLRMEESWDKRPRGEQWNQNNKGTSKKLLKL